MRKKFWLIYSIAIVIALSVVYATAEDLVRPTIALSDAQLNAIRGAWKNYTNQKCVKVGGCADLDCEPGVRDHDQVGNPDYAQCFSWSGSNCSEEEPPYTDWDCAILRYENNCQTPKPPWTSQWKPMCY